MSFDKKIRVYKKRWLILTVFSVYSISIWIQWVQFSVIDHIVMHYYKVSAMAVTWTTLVYLATYLILNFPAMFIVDKCGLKMTVISGAVLVTLGSWIKVASIAPDRFWVAFVGQTFVSISQIFMLSLPPKISSAWFPTEQISTANSVPFIALQFGIAIGFILSPFMVENSNDLNIITGGLKKLHYSMAGLSTISLILIILVFRAKPPHPPSLAEALRQQLSSSNYLDSFKNLSSNKSYWMILIAFAINQGFYNVLTTLLSKIIFTSFPGEDTFVGRVGLVIIICSLVGTCIAGFLLDKTHLFKLSCLLSNSGVAIFYIGLSISILYKNYEAVYLTSVFVGLFLGLSFLTYIEFSIELTYPEFEECVSGFMLMMSQLFGIAMTYVYKNILISFGRTWADSSSSCILLVGTLILILISPDYKRQQFLKCPLPISVKKTEELVEL